MIPAATSSARSGAPPGAPAPEMSSGAGAGVASSVASGGAQVAPPPVDPPRPWRLSDLFLRPRFFAAWGVAAVVVGLGFAWPPLVSVGAGLAAVVLVASVADALAVSRASGRLRAGRSHEPRLSLGDDNLIRVRVDYSGGRPLVCRLVEELPVEFQARDFGIGFALAPGESRVLSYPLRPTTRGVYGFGQTLVFVRSALGLVECRRGFGPAEREVPVYPSVLQMRQQALRVRQIALREGAARRQRQRGRSYEFDQIKNYVPGDDYRQINWKATARSNVLMTNSFVDERSQQVVAVIDAGRAMLSPFDGLSLLDYAINASLALLNVAQLRGDRVGLLAFDRAVHTALGPAMRPGQLQRALALLYAQRPTDFESDFDALAEYAVRQVRGRSLLLLFTNFTTEPSLERNLPALRRLSRSHVLVVVAFVNTEVAALRDAKPATLEEAYLATVAAEHEATQTQIVHKLLRQGIRVLRTRPQDLTADAVTRYLEVKRTGEL